MINYYFTNTKPEQNAIHYIYTTNMSTGNIFSISLPQFLYLMIIIKSPLTINNISLNVWKQVLYKRLKTNHHE